MLTLWQAEEAIRAFAGAEIDKARHYAFDHSFLLEMEPTVTHYDVFAAPTPGTDSG